MNLQQLEYLKTIAETENFTVAANLLSVTQPALSKSISKLEDELNVPLFEKNGRNIKLTRFGRIFLNHSNIALMEIEKGVKELEDIINPNTGTISISSTSSIGTYFMPFIISGFLNTSPNTKFQFNYQSIPDILKDLKSGKIDLGFYHNIDGIDSNDEIESIAIKREEYVLIVPKNHPLANKEEVYLSDLKNEYFIAYNNKSSDVEKSYSDLIGYTPKIYAEPSESSILSGLVAAGAGIAIILNTPLINTNKISVIKIKDKIDDKSIYMVWNKNIIHNKNKMEFKNYALNISKR